jgi:ketosteroid isomerase-like protein
MRTTRVGLIALSALTIAAPVAAHDTSAAKSAPVQLSPVARDAATTVDQFQAALRRGDTAAAQALLADDALIFEAGGVERGKADYAARHLPADAEFAKAVPATITRRSGRAEGDLAWVMTEGRTSGMFKGKAVDRLTTETMILRRTGGAWKIVHIHWSSGAAK